MIALVLALVLAAGAAQAQTWPAPLNQYALDQQISNEGVSNHVFVSPLRTMRTLTARSTVNGFLYVFDAEALPSNGAVTACATSGTARPCYMWCVPLTASTPLYAEWGSPLRFTTGVVVGYSTTGCASLTASTTAQFAGQTP